MRLGLACFFLCVLCPPAAAQMCPNVMLVVQGTGVMLTDPMGVNQRPSKWDLAVSRIVGGLDLRPRYRYGLEIFGGGSCETSIRVPLGSSAAKIKTALMNHTPYGSTNTGGAIRHVCTDGGLDDPKRDNYILLVVGGSPNCNGRDPEYTLDEIKKAAALVPPVRTIVAGFPWGAFQYDLSRLAFAGGMPRNGGACGGKGQPPCYYDAGDPADFAAALAAAGQGACGCDETCLGLGCPLGQRCEIAAPRADGVCRPNPCLGDPCPAGFYCHDGTCFAPCPPCGRGERCVGGACVADDCATVGCGAGMVCVSGGRCVTDKCAMNPACCTPPSVCDPESGACVNDPCKWIACPEGTACKGGWCIADPVPDMSVAVDLATEQAPPNLEAAGDAQPPLSDGCGCAVGGRPGSASPAAALLLLVGLLRARRRVHASAVPRATAGGGACNPRKRRHSDV